MISKYCYEITGGSVKGDFNIYQAKNGSIQLLMGNRNVELSQEQVLKLGIDVYSLIDFEYDDYKAHYNITHSPKENLENAVEHPATHKGCNGQA